MSWKYTFYYSSSMSASHTQEDRLDLTQGPINGLWYFPNEEGKLGQAYNMANVLFVVEELF